MVERDLSAWLQERALQALTGDEASPVGATDDMIGADLVGDLDSLPAGWQVAVDTWVRVGCPKGDPMMLGFNLQVLNQLAQLPREFRLPLLRSWRGVVKQRVASEQEALARERAASARQRIDSVKVSNDDPGQAQSDLFAGTDWV